MKPRVFVTTPLLDAQLGPLRACAEVVTWSGDLPPSPSELDCAVKGCQGLLCLLTDSVDEALIVACPDLQWVSSMSVGVDHVDVAALTNRGIPLGNTPGVLVDTTADLCFALLLAAARRVAEGDRYVRAGLWREENRWAPNMFVGKDVAGATLGIIGLGEIGQAVARRAAGFGMSVLGWTRSGRNVSGVESVGFDELLAESDFVSVNVALTEDTRNMLDAAAIAKMKIGAVLINTARGGIVDELALAGALQEGRLSAAGIDVFASEPVRADNPLLSLENVVLLPHVGSATRDTRAQMAQLAVANMCAAVTGDPMPHCVNPEVYADGR